MTILNYFLKNKNYLVLVFTILYLSSFTLISLTEINFEFLYYTFLITLCIIIVTTLDKKLHLGFFILFNLSLLGFLHLLGGNLLISDKRLYDFLLIPGWPWHYDNFVHAYGSFIATLALYSLLSNYIDQRIKQRYFIFALILMLMAMGIGTIVELFELGAVLFFNAAAQVGDYYNNAFDLYYNTLGAALATIIIYFYRERPKFIQKINEVCQKDN